MRRGSSHATPKGHRHRIRKDCTPSGPRALSAADYKLNPNPEHLSPLSSLFTSITSNSNKHHNPAHLHSTPTAVESTNKPNATMSLKNGGFCPFRRPVPYLSRHLARGITCHASRALQNRSQLLTPKPDKFPASAAFDEINNALNASEADRKDALKQGNAVFAFNLKNAAGEVDSWHIDLKSKGGVFKGLGEKPTGAFRYMLTTTTTT